MSTTASSITSDVAPAGFVPILDDQLFEHGERLKDKVVIITGAASGIGKEAAIRFASFGAKIVIGDLDVVGAEQTVSDIVASGGQATARKCNVTMWDDQVELFELAIQKYGSVDVVIPNAGIGEPESFLEVKLDKTGRPQKINLPTVHVNLTGVLYSVHLAQHYLVVNRKPNTQPLKAIVLIGSMASWQAFPLAPTYSASKHAVLGLMRSLDPILTLRGIRIACINPFFADTGILPTPLKVFLAGCPLTPVPRIAGAIIYAASHPDPATSGCAYVLPDDGPVFKVPREEFKAGVYQLLEGKLQSITGIIYAIKYATDIVKIVAKPLFASVIAVGLARVLWFNRETLWTSLHI
ncbi:uncharacterized protein C8R40DRAFT_1121274 [Lentinula edodes]|uniref:uncharacterized protein n=1 Tax=Lentinula edodes TaxID=5353 RepID=UPI001E8CBC40|nr:uncharacterized protein C8R40DRAFT_1121274 [Lentinula edodes]KAH7871610.1 hypothetical protein C8R40DRAFT_1121274 [Lentinula edodes]